MSLTTGKAESVDFTDSVTPAYVAEMSGEVYTGAKIFEVCGESEVLARFVWSLLEWQHPETLIDELQRDRDEESEDICRALEALE